jgi:hypothetical protein
MQGTYNYIPETNLASRAYNIADIFTSYYYCYYYVILIILNITPTVISILPPSDVEKI